VAIFPANSRNATFRPAQRRRQLRRTTIDLGQLAGRHQREELSSGGSFDGGLYAVQDSSATGWRQRRCEKIGTGTFATTDFPRFSGFSLGASPIFSQPQRQRAGIEAAKTRGVYLGRRTGSTKAKPERALELRASGLTVDEIATAMGVARRTAMRYLSGHR
jgi:hypothetical protein